MQEKVNRTGAGAADEHELTFASMARSIWRTRHYAVAAALLALAVGIVAVLLMRAGLPTQQISRAGVRFVFPKIEQQKYPNDRPFSMSDLSMPVVLEAVHKRNNLQDYGIDLARFSAAVTVQSYSIIYEEIANRYRQRLNNRKLSFAEQQVIERDMKTELTQQLGQYAVVEMVMNARFGLPQAVALKIVHDIPEVWADYAINQLGVMKTPEALDSAPLVDAAVVAAAEPIVAADMLGSGVQSIRQRIQDFRAIGGVDTVKEAETGMTAGSILRTVEDLQNFRLSAVTGAITVRGISDDPARAIGHLQRRLTMLKAERAALTERLAATRAILDEYFKGGAPTPVAAGVGQPASGAVQPGSASVNQVSDGVVERIVRLTREALDVEFRRDIAKDQIKQTEELGRIDELVRNLESWTASFTKAAGDRSSAQPADAALKKEIGELATTLNKLWKVSGNLFEQMSAKRFDYTGKLYFPIAMSGTKSYEEHHPAWEQSVMTWLAALALLGAFAGVMFGILSQILRRA